MKKGLLLFLMALCLHSVVFSQTTFDFNQPDWECGTDQLHQHMMATDAEYKANHEASEALVYRRMSALQKSELNNLQKNNPLSPCIEGTAENAVTLPVVVFIVYSANEQNPIANPTDEQVLDGLELMNNMFRSFEAELIDSLNPPPLNPDSLLRRGVDVEIQFELAKRDKLGNPTPGIYRIESDEFSIIDSFDEGRLMQESINAQIGEELFPGSDYIQLFYVFDIEEINGINPAGFASLGGITRDENGGNIVVQTSSLTTRTQTHELGHYFGLHHTFNGGCENADCLLNGDFVCDTPPDDIGSGSSCNNPVNSCSTDLQSGPFTVDQFDPARNFMDYSGACGTRFSQGQKDRMWSFLLRNETILNSKGGISTNMMEAGINAITYPNTISCDATFVPIVEIENNGNTMITEIKLQTTIDGGIPEITVQSVNLPVATSQNISLDEMTTEETGTHTIFVEILELNAEPVDNFIKNNYYCREFEYREGNGSLPICESLDDANFGDNFYLDFPQFKGYNERTLEVGIDNSCVANNQVIQFISRDGETAKENSLISHIELGGYTSAEMTFDLSHKSSYTNRITSLEISVSEDCGLSYTPIYNKSHTALSTAVSQQEIDAFYEPQSCEDWRTESIVLDDYAGGNNLLLKITVSIDGAWGQNLYLDNICIEGIPCTPIINTSENLGLITNCDEDSMLELQVGNINEFIQDPSQAITGWWITKDVPAGDIMKNKSEFMSGLETVNNGTALTSAANVVYEGDAITGDLMLNIDCNNLEDATYFAAPFVSGKSAEVPGLICENIQGAGNHTSVNSGDVDGSIVTVSFNECTAESFTTPTFTITVDVTDFTETLPANIELRLRNGDNTNLVSKTITIESLPATFVYTEADFPPNFDPRDSGLRVFLMNFNSAYAGSGNPTISFDYNLDLNYPTIEEVTFPNANYYDFCAFSTPISFTCNCNNSLPIELLTFYGEKIKDEVKLTWETQAEQNTDYFEIAHSTDGVNFEFVGRLASKNNTANSYQLMHADPENGSNYYQLKQFDLNQAYKTYGPIEVYYESKSTVTAYPIPTKVGEQLKVEYNALANGILNYKLLDVTGKVILNQTRQINLGKNNWFVPTENLNAGVYFLEMDQNFDQTVIKIITY